MAGHWYLLPLDTVTRAPKHLEPPEDGMRWASVRYIHGDDTEYVALVRAELSAARHAAIEADTDCLVLPEQNVVIIPGALSTIRAMLNARNIPSGWVTAGMTYGQVYRGLAMMGMLWGKFRHRARGVRFFGNGVTPDSSLASVPTGMRQHLLEIARDNGIDTSGITTVKGILLAWRQSMRDEPIVVLDEVL